MKVRLNGRLRQVPQDQTVADLLRDAGYDRATVAVALNQDFVPRGAYETRIIRDGDEVEVVKPMQGG